MCDACAHFSKFLNKRQALVEEFKDDDTTYTFSMSFVDDYIKVALTETREIIHECECGLPCNRNKEEKVTERSYELSHSDIVHCLAHMTRLGMINYYDSLLNSSDHVGPFDVDPEDNSQSFFPQEFDQLLYQKMGGYYKQNELFY